MNEPLHRTGKGLCGSCIHAETSANNRGSEFILCGLSRTDPAYPKYPRLPVVACAGYRPAAADHANDRPSKDSQ